MRNKKHTLPALLLAVLVLCLGLAFTACGNETKGGEIGISPSSQTYVGGNETKTDLRFDLTPETAEVASVWKGEEQVDAENWTSEGGVLVLKADWLETLGVGTYQMKIKNASGKEASFTVVCFKRATVSPAKGDYDWVNPADVSFTVDLGGATLLGVSIGDTTLTASQYTLTGNTLTISEATIESECSEGDNVCTLKTSVNEVNFTIHCYSSVIEAKFDSSAFKIQSRPDSDITFEFDAVGMPYTVQRLNGTEWEDVEEGEVEYSASAHTLTVSGDVLAERHAGIDHYRVSVEDDADSVFNFEVGVFGKEGTAQLAKVSPETLNDFDAMAPNANLGGNNSTFDTQDTFYSVGMHNEVIEGANAIDGHSLAMISDNGAEVGWNIFFGVNFGAVRGTTYRAKMDLKLIRANDSPNPAIYFRQFESEANQTNEFALDYRSDTEDFAKSGSISPLNTFSYNAETGVLTVEVYFSPSVDGMHFRMTLVNGGKATVVLDNFSILRTDIPASTTVANVSSEYVKKSGGAAEIAVNPPAGMQFVSASSDGTALTAEQFTFEDGVATFAESWMQALQPGNHTVQLTFSYVKDVIGTEEDTTMDITISVFNIELPHLITKGTQKQTAEKEALVYELSSGDYTLSSVTEDGKTVEAANYALDTAEGTFTLNKDYLNGLTVGLHTYTLTFTAEEEEEDDYEIEIFASVYSNDYAITNSHIGVLNFRDYAAGTKLSDIISNEALTGTGAPLTPVIVNDEVFGTSLKIGNAGSSILSAKNLADNVPYIVRMVFRTENNEAVKDLLWKWNGGNAFNASWIKNDVMDPGATDRDIRSTIKKVDNTTYVWTAYVGPKRATDNDLILWAVTAQQCYIASIEFFDSVVTDSNFVSGSAKGLCTQKSYNYMVPADDSAPATFIQNSTRTVYVSNTSENYYASRHINAEAKNGFYDFRICKNGTPLVKDEDYVMSGNKVYLTAAYLAEIADEETVTLTLERGTRYLDGTILWQSATLNLDFRGPACANIVQKQTKDKKTLEWTLSLGDFTLKSVTCNGDDVQASNYVFEKGKAAYDDSKFALKDEYISTLSIGVHTYHLTFSCEGKDDFTMDISAIVYGNDFAHMNSQISAFDFRDYETGMILADITPTTGLNGWNGGPPTIVEDALFGKSLKIGNAGAGILEVKGLADGIPYIVRMVFRTENNETVKSLLWKWTGTGQQRDACWIKEGAMDYAGKDIRSTIETLDNGAYVWTAYVGPKVASDNILTLWAVTAQQCYIASFELFEAVVSDQNFLTGNKKGLIDENTYNYRALNGQFLNTSTVEVTNPSEDVMVAKHPNTEAKNGYVGLRVCQGETELESGVDYEVRPDNTVYIKAAYLAKIKDRGNVTLTFQRGLPLVDGTIRWQSATLTLNFTAE